jgi:hypothetical protein
VQDQVNNVRFSRDGRTIATAGGAIQLYEAATRDPIGAPIKASSAFGNVWFSPDDSLIYSVDDHGRGFRMPVTPAAWKAQACAIAGRPLTRGEWNEFVPGTPYEPACR